MSDYGKLSTTRKIALKAMGGVHDASSSYLANRDKQKIATESSKMSTIAALLSGISAVGIEKLTESDYDYILKHGGGTDISPDSKVHFLDKLMDRLSRRVSNTGDHDELKSMIYDKHRVQTPGLSIRRLVSNFRKLSTQMDAIFVSQYYIISVISWDSPSLTLTFLILYTWGCSHPYLFLIYPIICLLANVIIPNYLMRHPLEKPGHNIQLAPIRPRGDASILGFLNGDSKWGKHRNDLNSFRASKYNDMLDSLDDDDQSIVTENPTDTEADDTSMMVHAFADDDKTNLLLKPLLTGALLDDPKDKKDDEEEDEKSKGLMGKLKMLINMRDLQNLTTYLVAMIDQLQDAVNDACSFKDEKKTTRLFFSLIMIVIVVLALGPFIPWRATFILSMWIFLLVKHPKRQAFFENLSGYTLSSALMSGRKSDEKTEDKPLLTIEKDHIIIDEKVVYKTVQVYEIQRQDYSNPMLYVPFIYSVSPFATSSSRRRQRKKPKGSADLKSVKAPSKQWRFYNESQWIVDRNPEAWCTEINIVDEVYFSDDFWVYDLSGEYRRRRLTRSVIRSGK